LTLTAKRVPPAGLDLTASNTHDLPGDTFRRLSDDVAYLKLSSIKAADVRRYIDAVAGIRDGRDEVLEEAIRQILGRETTIAQI
jgi:hypothetical protein